MEFDPRTLGNFRQKKESDKYLHCPTFKMEMYPKEFFEKTEKQLIKEFKASAKGSNLLPKLKGVGGHGRINEKKT